MSTLTRKNAKAERANRKHDVPEIPLDVLVQRGRKHSAFKAAFEDALTHSAERVKVSKAERRAAMAQRASDAVDTALGKAKLIMPPIERQTQVDPISTPPQGVVNKPTSATKKVLAMNDVSRTLLSIALERNAEPLTENYAKALKPDRKTFVLEQRCVFAHAVTKFPKPEDATKAAVLAFDRLGAISKAHFVDGIRTIMRDATFSGHIMLVRAERAESMTPTERNEQLLNTLAELGGLEDPTMFAPDEVDPSTRPQHDDPRHDSELNSAPVGLEPRTPYEGPSVEDITDGLEYLNVWLTKVVRALLPKQGDRDYYGIDPLPFTSSRWDGSSQTHYLTLADARAYLDEQWKTRNKTTAQTADVRAMLEELAAE